MGTSKNLLIYDDTSSLEVYSNVSGDITIKSYYTDDENNPVWIRLNKEDAQNLIDELNLLISELW